MRLGGFFDETFDDPASWVAILREKGYRAAYAPYRVEPGGRLPPAADVAAYAAAARAADIVIAEVGAWGRNLVAEDQGERERAIGECVELLRLADGLDARCLVTSAGWRRDPAENFAPATFELIVAAVRAIVDAARPARASFTLEMVPDIHPHSVDGYRELLAAVDRPAFGVHVDLANLAATPWDCHHSDRLARDCVQKLGPLIRSCHAKDVVVRKGMISHVDEIRPGLGCLDYPALIGELDRLDPELPLMMEHLSSNAEYRLAAEYLRGCARGGA
jgi:sugar phosphate isomerase/epimerase